MATVALQMIVKDEVEEVTNILLEARGYFDQINITVSDKTACNKLKKVDLGGLGDKTNIKWREWTDDFSAARNDNFAMATTDYVFWLDADDEFDFSKIPKLVQLAEKGQYVVIYLPYNYAQDEEGRCVARHWRERLIRRSHDFEWRGRVHETCISDTPYKSTRVTEEVVHRGSDHHSESVDRNHKILLKAVNETDDPRYLHYLGLSYYTRGENKDAIKTLEKFVRLSGWDEEIYRSYCTMSEAAYADNQTNLAMNYALQAAAMMPAYPHAYWLLTQYESDQDNFAEGFEWAKVAVSKPIPKTMSIVDPTNVSRTILVGARCAYMLGNYAEAWKWIQKIPDEPLAKEIFADFKAAAEKEVFLKLLPTLVPYFKDEKALYEALTDGVKYDNRANGLRQIAVTPKVWGPKEITIFCGQGFEEWGPHKLDQGMGGSEEAIVYLSRELCQLGWNVTVYGEVEEPYHECFVGEWVKGQSSRGTVTYLPWRYLDRRDKFNVLICWRTPAFAPSLDAKVKIVDMHDLAPEAALANNDATFFVKSQYQRDLYPNMPDDKFVIVGNGIVRSQFDENKS